MLKCCPQANVNATSASEPQGTTALWIAAFDKQWDLVEKMLKNAIPKLISMRAVLKASQEEKLRFGLRLLTSSGIWLKNVGMLSSSLH